jgi:recombinational DNA repair protein RecR
VFPEEATNEQFITDQQPRCEIGKVFTAGEECQRPGEVQLDGSLLCVHHAELLRVGERSENLIGTVFVMDQWLESVDGEADEERVRRVEQQRNEAVEQLRFNRTRISLIHDELLRDHDGTT